MIPAEEEEPWCGIRRGCSGGGRQDQRGQCRGSKEEKRRAVYCGGDVVDLGSAGLTLGGGGWERTEPGEQVPELLTQERREQVCGEAHRWKDSQAGRVGS